MFQPNCLPVLIGSLPLSDHVEAMQMILANTPEIPLWPQLPKRAKEGMVRQFLSGFPGLQDQGNRHHINTETEDFPEQMAAFYADAMRADEDREFFSHSRFSLGDDTARGFSVMLTTLTNAKHDPITVKGQVTGPVTTGIGTRDQHDNSIIYDDNLRDMLAVLLAQKGRWQALHLQTISGKQPPIIFIDEPAMVSFGSSAFAGVTKELVTETVSTVIAGIHQGGGLAGIHICANGDWQPALSCPTDIISFDAYSYFDNFLLYREQLLAYLNRGGFLAWGIVPTGEPEAVSRESAHTLFQRFRQQLAKMAELGINEDKILSQTFISPACGTGSLPLELARKVLEMTADMSKIVRQYAAR